MPASFDVVASLFLGGSCALLLGLHLWRAVPRRYRRIEQQGASFFLGRDLMHAGYWMLQPVIRACTRFGVSPALLTWCSLAPAAAAAAAIITGHWGAAAWCLLGSALLDVLDGAVARSADQESAVGAVLDSALDRYAEFIFFSGALVFYRDRPGAQLIVLLALFGSFLITYSTAKAEALRVTPPRGPMKRSDRMTLLIVGCALTPLAGWFAPAERAQAWPALGAFTLIAILANVSAIRRFAALAGAVRAPQPFEPVLTKRRDAFSPRGAAPFAGSDRTLPRSLGPNPRTLP